MRINNDIDRGQKVTFTFNGKAYSAYEGESVACALFAEGIAQLRTSPRSSHARGMFCLMGSCQECLVWVGDRKLPSCQQVVVEGLQVRSLSEKDA